MNNNNNINLISLIRLLASNLKTVFIGSTLMFLFFVVVYFSFFKTQSYKYMLSSNLKPMSYIEFTKIFTYTGVELIIKDGSDERKLGSNDDNFNKSRLTPLTIYYHFISILEREYDKKFDSTLNKSINNKNKFLNHEKKWNHTQIIYNFNIDTYGNDPIYLKKKFDEAINESMLILVNDISNYLKKYEKQNINDIIKIKKINNTIKSLKKENMLVRISQFRVNKIINLNVLYLFLMLLTSLSLTISYILIRADIRLIQKKK